ncbi:glycoside hydrolase family 125 protein [Paenibacillus thalictri]|uniref:Metal-independent alpha-mannosidase n=1 Tax=Paenibacillus thalictri TaxID=2527873 RepID=A0A4Q9DSY7_9BACL|nr:glycoside hydrolase family 125 protein [Paenibacillus thalictri]TBL79085.1 metal-independent alpha-mannosidase [Paenibacillus thalictri]
MERYYALQNKKNKKPLDVGCGSLSASIGLDGRLRSVNAVHPVHGFVTLTPLEPFDNGKWYDSGYVRQYRKRIVGEPAFVGEGFGFQAKLPVANRSYGYVDETNPVIVESCDGFEITHMYSAVSEAGASYLIHEMKVENIIGEQKTFFISFGGNFSMNRCSYGQLTEGGPILMPDPHNRLKAGGHHMAVSNPNLGARADMLLFDNGQPLAVKEHDEKSNLPVSWETGWDFSFQPGEIRRLHAVYSISADAEAVPQIPGELAVLDMMPKDLVFPQLAESGEDETSGWAEFVIRRNVDYIVNCCSVPVDDSVCIITDHQLLPLAWNRDSYYMIQLLIEADRKEGFLSSELKRRVHGVVRGHLLWMFEQAERPNGYWGRAYLTNGYCKDNVFQLDQQCYPLLELCDYYEWTGDEVTVKRIASRVKPVLDDLLENRDAACWIFRTGETPADDKVDFPYHFSSQVLMWHTLRKLAQLNETFDFTGYPLAEWAEQIHHDILRHFVVERDGVRMFAYLSDLQGNVQCYHDANDLPTLLAPSWGFCGKDDPIWLHTIAFAFKEANAGGFYEGPYGGLGSVHTPHAWPLGDAQELLFSSETGDRSRYARVLSKLESISFWDGMLSEGVNEHTGAVESRHWFSWPGAFLSQVLLKTGDR